MIRVFPVRTKWTPSDDLSFVGDPPLFRPQEMPVRISVTFTWDIPEGKRLLAAWRKYYKDVLIGGPAFNDSGGEFEPGRFIKKGVTITSRGCPKRCGFCLVSKREGQLREIQIKDGWIVQDNNLLACTRPHIEAVFDMLRHQPRPAVFSGGLDTMLLQDWHRKLIDTLRVKELWVACDSSAALKSLKRAARILEGLPQRKKRCYVMVGYDNENIADAEKRLNAVFEMGFDPFCQLYRGKKESIYSTEWRRLARKWARPAAYHSGNMIKEANLGL